MRRSVFGTRGASDCAGCVGVALEAARALVANPDLTLPGPVVFLFNGGEETVLQASHGFMAHSRWPLPAHQGVGFTACLKPVLEHIMREADEVLRFAVACLRLVKRVLAARRTQSLKLTAG